MLRIAVTGVAASELEEVGLRLRGAALEACDGADASDPAWGTADAAARFGASARDLDAIERSLKAGKHVLSVAAGGLPEDDRERLTALAGEHGVVFAVENPDHALPSRRLIRQQIESGRLGEVGLLRIQRGESRTVDRTAAQGLPDALIGDVELAVWLVGSGPETVYAVRRDVTASDGLHGEYVQVHLGFPWGGMALVSWTDAWPPGDAHQSLSVIAATGAAYADDHVNRQLLFQGGPATAPRADEGSVVAALLQEFAAGVQSGRDWSRQQETWRHVARTAAAIKQSLDTQRAVAVEAH